VSSVSTVTAVSASAVTRLSPRPCLRLVGVYLVFRLNTKGSPQVNLSTRLAIAELVIESTSQLWQRSIITGSWMQSWSINLDRYTL
jgi:hypothetical protein